MAPTCSLCTVFICIVVMENLYESLFSKCNEKRKSLNDNNHYGYLYLMNINQTFGEAKQCHELINISQKSDLLSLCTV